MTPDPQQSSIDPSSQPQPAKDVPESFSQPIAHQAERLLTKSRRAIADGNDKVYQFGVTTTAQLPGEEFDTEARLRRGVFEVIVDRLKA